MTRARIHRRLSNLAERLDRAAHIVPNVEDHLASQLAYCDSSGGDTVVVSGGELNDPVIRQVMARSHIVHRSNAIDAAVTAIEEAINQLDEACRAAHAPREANDAPLCYVAGCTKFVEHYRRADQTIAYRSEGMCSAHRSAARREDVA